MTTARATVVSDPRVRLVLEQARFLRALAVAITDPLF
jgi:hypothetical protein